MQQQEAHIVEIEDVPHGTPKIYTIGFILSIVLTAIPFTLVMTGALPTGWLVATIVVLAVVQIIVHLVAFLHLNRSSGRGWNLTAFAYTLVVLIVLIGASIWIMFHLNYNMMQGMGG